MPKTSARRAFVAISIAVAFLMATTALVVSYLFVEELKVQAALQQSEVLASAARASVHNDLLNANMLLASDRLRSMLDTKNADATCIAIEPVVGPMQTTVRLGNERVCKNASIQAVRRKISFDTSGDTPAFSILVKVDPRLLNFSISRRILILLAALLLLPFALLWFLSSFANRILVNIFRIVNQSHDDSLVDDRRYYEYDAIKNLIIERNENVLVAVQAESQAKEARALSALASQVSHDIRSPLAALNVVLRRASELPPETNTLIRAVAQRINDIANDLLRKGKEIEIGKAPTQTLRPAALVDSLLPVIVSEKRLQHSTRSEVKIVESDSNTFGVFISVTQADFFRVVSNITNNAVEAISGCGEVRISTTTKSKVNEVIITIADTGRGIPPDRIAEIGRRGASFDKDGSGFGVHHAIKTMQDLGGRLELQSQLGIGTEVRLILPIADTPQWFCTRLHFHYGQTIVILDDDLSVLETWKSRLDPYLKDQNLFLRYFSNTLESEAFLSSALGLKSYWLVDHELDEGRESGLNVIRRLGISDKAVLVTSAFSTETVQQSALKLSIKILPKFLIPLVPIDGDSF